MSRIPSKLGWAVWLMAVMSFALLPLIGAVFG